MGENGPLFLLYMDIVTGVRGILSPMTERRKVEIVDITYKREGPTMVLRILLDKADGITIDECGQVNKELSELLDKENIIIDEHYILEVSSPGLAKPIKTERDFRRALGKDVKVTTYAPIDGKNVFIGKLLGIRNSTIVLEDNEGISTEIPRAKIANARLEITL